MKVKEVDRTANIAWSPATQHPIYLAAGTAAQQLDASFSTSAALEIYALNLTEPGLEMGLKGSLSLDHRLNKVAWGNFGMNDGTRESGVLVAGSDGGDLLVYDADKIINGQDDVELFHSNKHSTSISSLDFNPFQNNLMVSGGGDSEILIWDLNNPNSPMTPGAKSQPLEEISCVAWNRQVQHILASTFPARCVVWDLRKNEPIIKVSDSSARLRLKVVAWHPEVATQLCFASEDDHSPVIQLWDLRFATSPLKVLESHQRGVLSIAWCPQDPDLLLSCGKDNRIICWNPNSSQAGGEVVCELPTNNQWSFEVAWCPRNPAVIASSSFDGHVSVYSLMGGQQQLQPSSKIAESFPGADTLTPLQPSVSRSVSMPLHKPPKWLRRPVGATFAFGGKLVSFNNDSKTSHAGVATQNRSVTISQVITEPTIVKNATQLEESLKEGTLADFCKSKLDKVEDNHHKMIWNFLYANFDPSPRSLMLSLLGYDPQEIAVQLEPLKKSGEANLTEKVKDISLADQDSSSTFDDIAANVKITKEPFHISADEDTSAGTLARALLTGNIEAAVELCITQNQWADALVLAQAGGTELLKSAQKRYLTSVVSSTAKLISAVVNSDWENVVRNCDLECWKEALAAVLTYAIPSEFALLCDILGKRLEEENTPDSIKNAMLCYICSGNLENLTTCWVSINNSSSSISSSSLQNLIEQMMILKRTMELMGSQVEIKKNGVLSDLLGKYVILLATQGSLALASTFIRDASEPSLVTLKDRLLVALSPPSDVPSKPIGTHVAPKAVPQQFASISSSNQNYSRPSSTFSSGQQMQKPYYQPQNQVNQPAPSYDSFYNPAAQIQSGQSYNSMAPPPPLQGTPYIPQQSNPTPPPPPPPTASSEPAASAKGGLSHRYPSRLHDPSVYSEPSYGQTPYGQQQFGYNQPAPQQFGSLAYQPAPQPQSYFNVEQSGANAPHGNFAAPAPASNSYTPPIQSSNHPLPTNYSDPNPGWNDPPPLKSSTRKSSGPSSFHAPDSMMTPFLNPQEAVPQNPPPMPGGFMNQQPPANFVNPMPPSGSLGFQPQPTPAVFPGQNVPSGNMFGGPNYDTLPPQPSQSFTPMQPATLQPQAAPTPPPPTPPEPPKEKGPISPENQILQDTLEDLRQQCHQRATNPQVRRKLDDVARKLETLYDKLRDNTLSSNTLTGLHQIIQMIQQGDYHGSLTIHTQLVSTTNFSETSSFMLGLKVLLQTAQQLGVYLQ